MTTNGGDGLQLHALPSAADKRVCVWHHALTTLLPVKSPRIQRIGGLIRRRAGLDNAKKYTPGGNRTRIPRLSSL